MPGSNTMRQAFTETICHCVADCSLSHCSGNRGGNPPPLGGGRWSPRKSTPGGGPVESEQQAWLVKTCGELCGLVDAGGPIALPLPQVFCPAAAKRHTLTLPVSNAAEFRRSAYQARKWMKQRPGARAPRASPLSYAMHVRPPQSKAV